MKSKKGLSSFFIVNFNDVSNWIGLILILVLFGFAIWMFVK